MAISKQSVSAVREAYLARTTKSREAYADAQRWMPGGISRQVAFWLPYPLTIVRGDGTHIWDLDGNKYIDLTNNYTSLVHGHAYPPIVAAVAEQVPNGTAWSANNPHQADLARQIVERVPSIQKVRFTNSGSEAANLALLIARELTGRQKVLMARFGYHGSLQEFESGTLDKPGPETLLAEFGNADDFEAVLAEHGSSIAAVFLEPVMGAGGIISADADFFHRVHKAARKAGALFVLDEVITLRLHERGQQSVLGIEPDLTMMAKLIGGGFPVGAVGGPDEIMKALDPGDMKVFHSGTFNANPVTMAAGAVSFRELTQEKINRMAVLCERFEERLAQTAAKHGLPFSTTRQGSLLNIYFSDRPGGTSVRGGQDAVALFHLAALRRGLFPAARGMFVLSTIMDDALIDEMVQRADDAMADLAAELS